MPRLYRPSIPLEVRCRVVLRQIGEMFPDDAIDKHRKHRGGLGEFLIGRLAYMAAVLRCDVADLRLDHNPALALRKRRGEGKNTVYVPAANDPEFLVYREKHAHHIKTNVHGDGAQFSDTTLIKRQRRRERRELKTAKKASILALTKPKSAVRKKFRWPKRSFEKRIK